MEHFKTLSSYFEYLELPRPEHPMLSVFNSKGDDYLPCPKESSPPITNDCYSISFKKYIEGNLSLMEKVKLPSPLIIIPFSKTSCTGMTCESL